MFPSLRWVLLAAVGIGVYALRRVERRAAAEPQAISSTPPSIERWEGEGGGVPVSNEHTAAQVPVEHEQAEG